MKRQVRQNLVGKQFGRLTVIEQADDRIKPNGQHETMWLCKCSCGDTKIVRASVLKNGNTTSCGCLAKEILANRNKNNSYGSKGPNKLILHTEYVELILQDGSSCLIDHADYGQFKTKRIFKTKSGYAATSIGGKQIKIHQLILPARDGLVVDHINRNKLDNRRNNLRLVTSQQNIWNRDLPLNKFGGHCIDKVTDRFRVRVHLNKQIITLGYFDTVEAAKECYEDFVKNNRIIDNN